jgi:hypothetical protein
MAFRFFLENGGQARITFLDGDFTAKGLEPPWAYEHFAKVMGKPMNFTCIHEENQLCPICESGDKPAYVCYFTILDHREYVSKKDGSIHHYSRRLFAPKRGTYKQLSLLASKRGGLRGWTVDVSRTGPKEPSVGNVFDFLGYTSPENLSANYGADAEPLDYDAMLQAQTLSEAELRKMGFGTKGIGSEVVPATASDGYGL